MEVDLHLFHVRLKMEISQLSSVALHDPLNITMKPNTCDFVTLLRSVFCVSTCGLGRADGHVMLMSETDVQVWTRCPRTNRTA